VQLLPSVQNNKQRSLQLHGQLTLSRSTVAAAAAAAANNQTAHLLQAEQFELLLCLATLVSLKLQGGQKVAQARQPSYFVGAMRRGATMFVPAMQANNEFGIS
jgi:hypothetical protein